MQPNEIKQRLEQLLANDAVFCFQNVEISGEITEFLFSHDSIKKIYFIGYENSSFQKIKDIITNKEIFLIDSLTNDIISDSTLVFCLNKSNYFNPNYSLIAKNKAVKGICFLGFAESLFSIKPNSKEMAVVNLQLIDLLKTNQSVSLRKIDVNIDKSRICHNRKHEKTKLEEFLANSDKRLLILHGFPGSGKNNLLDELVRKAPNRTYHYFNFQDKFDTYKDIINELSPYLSFVFQQEELNNTNIRNRSQSALVNNFIRRFCEKENSILVFDSMDKVFEYDNGIKFISDELDIFFERLITQHDFRSTNKIIFLSRLVFSGNFKIRDFKSEIAVGMLLPFYIKRIMADEFNRLNKPELALKIAGYDDKIIDKAICGHPMLALRFVDASFKYSIDEILNNDEFNKQISSEIKIKWLLDNYPLEHSEKIVMEAIGLFSDDVPNDYLKTNFPNYYQIIDRLTSRFLLEVRFMKDGNVRYYVPKLIREYINGITDSQTIRENNLRIGDYFWDKAEDISASSFQKIHSFRKAFYHYNAAGDEEKLKLLIMRFKEKFLIEAWECSKNRDWDKAFFLFNELHIKNQMGINNWRDYNEFLKVISRMQNKPKDADKLFEDIHGLFPNNSFISITYADFFFDKKDRRSIIKALEECVRIKNLIERSKDSIEGNKTLDLAIIDNTIAKCFFSLDRNIEANSLIEEWKIYFEKRGVNTLTDKEKYHYQALIMTQYFKSIDDMSTYLLLKREIVRELITHGLDVGKFFFLDTRNEKIFCLKNGFSKKIKQQIEIAEKLNPRDRRLKTTHRNHVNNLMETDKFQKYLNEIERSDLPITRFIKNLIKAAEELITAGYKLLDKAKSINTKNLFTVEYAKIGLCEIEADFYLVREVIKKHFNDGEL
jgi:hypothetical protein